MGLPCRLRFAPAPNSVASPLRRGRVRMTFPSCRLRFAPAPNSVASPLRRGRVRMTFFHSCRLRFAPAPTSRPSDAQSWARSHNQKFPEASFRNFFYAHFACTDIACTKEKSTAHAMLSKLGYKDSNLEMTESESVALPFGDTPIYSAVYHSHE